MHKKVFCQNLFNNALVNSIHEKRKNCLVRFLSDLMDYDTTLSVTEIGKKLTSKSTVKSKINAANTLVNNVKLEQHIPDIYGGLAHFFWGSAQEIVVLIDWTGACSKGYHALEASVVGHGRSIPIYHEIHWESAQGNEAVHEQFLARLAQIIPSHLKVTIITDAGFYKNWFKQVLALGWEIIGRVFSRYAYKREKESKWHQIKDVPFEAIGKASALGYVTLGKTNSLKGYLYAYKEKLSNKIRRKKANDHDKEHSDYYKNGWVLFSSLNQPAHFLVSYYKKRMQIEQNFKDIKNESLGLGLRRTLSSGKTRINMLFFLAVLLIILAWWFGLMLERLGKHRSYQANSIKGKRIRSLVHLGRLGFRHEPQLLDWESFLKIMNELRSQYHTFIEYGVFIGWSK